VAFVRFVEVFLYRVRGPRPLMASVRQKQGEGILRTVWVIGIIMIVTGALVFINNLCAGGAIKPPWIVPVLSSSYYEGVYIAKGDDLLCPLLMNLARYSDDQVFWQDPIIISEKIELNGNSIDQECPCDIKPIVKWSPSYPPEAYALGIEGKVILRVRINSDGSVANAKVIKSCGSILDEASLITIKRWLFSPPQLSPGTKTCEHSVTFSFKIKQ
jgi:TonB family protein